jgi:negative regulator of sigma E activity
MAEETHVVVNHEAATEEAAAAAVATAEAAAALANETAAHAELQAAEEVAEIRDEAEEWRTKLEQAALDTGTALAMLSERLSVVDSREEERHRRDSELLARLEALENHPRLILRESEETERPSETTTEPQEAAEAVAEAASEAAAEVSSDNSSSATEEEKTSPSVKARRKRRWI